MARAHEPRLLGLVPEHLRVAEVFHSLVEHRVALVLLPGLAVVVAVGQRLGLQLGQMGRCRSPPDSRRLRSHKPLVLFLSTTALPEKIIFSPSIGIASGRRGSSAPGLRWWHVPSSCCPKWCPRDCTGRIGGTCRCGRPARWDRSSNSSRARSGRPAGRVRRVAATVSPGTWVVSVSVRVEQAVPNSTRGNE